MDEVQRIINIHNKLIISLNFDERCKIDEDNISYVTSIIEVNRIRILYYLFRYIYYFTINNFTLFPKEIIWSINNLFISLIINNIMYCRASCTNKLFLRDDGLIKCVDCGRQIVCLACQIQNFNWNRDAYQRCRKCYIKYNDQYMRSCYNKIKFIL